MHTHLSRKEVIAHILVLLFLLVLKIAHDNRPKWPGEK